MSLELFVLGNFAVNSYLIHDASTKKCIIIDPGQEPFPVIQYIENHQLQPLFVVNTHGHIDHIEGNGELCDHFSIQVMIGEGDAPMLTDPKKNLSHFHGTPVYSPAAGGILHDGDQLDIGESKIRIMETPGHSPGSISLLFDDSIICGDVLFSGSIGRTDFPGASYDTLMRTLHEKLLKLPDDTVVYPGHGPKTTIADERANNPFLQNTIQF